MRDTEKTIIQNQLKETQSELIRMNEKVVELSRELERSKFLHEDVTTKHSTVRKYF